MVYEGDNILLYPNWKATEYLAKVTTQINH